LKFKSQAKSVTGQELNLMQMAHYNLKIVNEQIDRYSSVHNSFEVYGKDWG